MRILIETDTDANGDPIYGKTLGQAIGEIMETETERRDASMDQHAAMFTELLGRPVTGGQGMEAVMLSDAFFNCQPVVELEMVEGEYPELATVAATFNAELPEPFRSSYTAEWLVKDFYDRL